MDVEGGNTLVTGATLRVSGEWLKAIVAGGRCASVFRRAAYFRNYSQKISYPMWGVEGALEGRGQKARVPRQLHARQEPHLMWRKHELCKRCFYCWIIESTTEQENVSLEHNIDMHRQRPFQPSRPSHRHQSAAMKRNCLAAA